MRKQILSLFLLTATMPAAYAQMIDAGETLKVGDVVTIEGEEYRVGPNLIMTNANFNQKPGDDGVIAGWHTADNATSTMTTSSFEWVETGGCDGKAYLKAKGHTGAAGNMSFFNYWPIESGEKYYFSFWLKNQGKDNRYVPVVSLTDVAPTKGGENEGGDHGVMVIGAAGNAGENEGLCLGYSKAGDPEVNNGWAQTQFYFEAHDYTYIQYDARWLDGTGTTPVCFDDFFLAKLYDKSTSPEEIMSIQLYAKIQEAQTLADELSDYPGLSAELVDNASEYEDPAETVDEIQAQLDAVDALMQKALVGKQAAADLNNALIANSEVSELAYPGLDAFLEVYEKMSDMLSSEDATADDYINGVDEFKAALKDYYLSQEATMENAADYTFLVANPQFTKEGGDFTNTDDKSSTGWVKGSTYTGGDQRLNNIGGKNCWNAWGTNFKGSYMDIHTDLTNIPNGWYSVSADFITQAGCSYQQRAYAKSAANTGESPYMTAEGEDWDNGIYQTLSSEEQKVLVMDGKLTIGAISEGRTSSSEESLSAQGDGRDGWFCVTNFVLSYYGEASAEDLKPFYEAKVAECKACNDTMNYAADKAAFAAVIAKYSNASGLEAMNTALDSLNAALDVAVKSQNTYVDYVSRPGCSLQVVKANLAGQNEEFEGYGVAEDIVKAGVAYYEAAANAATATYTEQGDVLNRFKKYAAADNSGVWKDYNAAEALKAVSTAEGQKVMQAAMDKVKAFMTAGKLQATNEVDSVVALMKADMAQVEIANALAAHTGSDYTSCIQNPGAEAETGWVINRGTGNTNTTAGQAYNGDANNRYFDSWNGTAGKLDYTAYQELQVPNGTYELKVMTRTSGQGAYIFAIPDADSTKAVASEIALNQHNFTKYNDITAEDGSDSIAVVTDKYGPIWEQYADKVQAGTELTDEEDAIYAANSNMGRGWNYTTVTVTVTDHKLSIGATTDSINIKNILGAEAQLFNGTWFSADSFTLTMISEGAGNEGWSPLTGIASVANDATSTLVVAVVNGKIVANAPVKVYAVDGKEMKANATLPAGIYVVKGKNQAVKVMVK